MRKVNEILDVGGGARVVLPESSARRIFEITTLENFPQAYNAGETTQVPTGRVVGVRRRVRRKVGYGGMNLSFERAGPAPR